MIYAARNMEGCELADQAAGDSVEKKCFVVSPIGAEGSEDRVHADWILEYVIKPVLTAEPFSFSVARADEIPEPGSITQQAILSTIGADLVVAILTGHNANVFYELAIRHMENKPTISMIEKGDSIPFDNQDQRTIQYSLRSPQDIEEAKKNLRVQVEAIGAPEYANSNPIIRARGFQRLAESADPKDSAIAEMMNANRGLARRIAALEKQDSVSAAKEIATRDLISTIVATATETHKGPPPTILTKFAKEEAEWAFPPLKWKTRDSDNDIE